MERGMAQTDIRDMFAARLGVASGRTAAAGRWSNPEIEYSRESLDEPDGRSDEDFLWIRQRLNVAGVHGLERDAARRLQAAEAARVRFAEREVARDIRRLFYTALATEQELHALESWRVRLEQLSTSVERRVSAGDASRYDQLRLARELVLLRAETTTLEASAESARDQLFSLIGGEPVALAGTLLPPSADDTAATDVVAGHPLLAALDAEAGSAGLSARAAARKAWPELTVGVGRHELDAPGMNLDGNLLMLGIEVPIFDRGDGEQFAAESRSLELQAERNLAASRLAAEARGALRRIEVRRQAALMLMPDEAEADSLSRIAERAYAEGEIGVMELIDAHRADLAAQREAIAHAHGARESWIELQTLGGNP